MDQVFLVLYMLADGYRGYISVPQYIPMPSEEVCAAILPAIVAHAETDRTFKVTIGTGNMTQKPGEEATEAMREIDRRFYAPMVVSAECVAFQGAGKGE